MYNKLKAFKDSIKLYFTHSFKLSIYMKSGNVIVCDGVTDYNVKYYGDAITSLQLTQKHSGQHLIVRSINLSQIEAMSRHY